MASVEASVEDSVPKVKIMTLGDSAVGKSSLVVRFTESTFEPDRLSTIGIDFRKKKVEIHEQELHLQIWDTAGQERFHTITAAYYRGVDAVLLVYDVSNRNTYAHVRKWVRDVESNNSRFENVKMILVANKCDLPASARKVTLEEGQELAAEFKIEHMEASAKTGVNVEECFMRLAELCVVMTNYSLPNAAADKDVDQVDLNQDGSGSSGGCCGGK